MPKHTPCSNMRDAKSCDYSHYLQEELDNFIHLLKPLLPRQRSMPLLRGMDIHGESIPLHEIGGDQVLFIDFHDKYDHPPEYDGKAGILLVDSAGHSTTTACLTSSFYYALHTGIHYELERHGQVTLDLFEKLSHVFHNTDGIFLTMTYGEIAEDGTFRYVLAAHPPPLVFSNKYDRFQQLGSGQVASTLPIGIAPLGGALVEKQYVTNQIRLESPGDIILLYTDGLQDHRRDDEEYFPIMLENVIRRNKNTSARDIAHSIREDLLKFAEPDEDISYVVMKKY